MTKATCPHAELTCLNEYEIIRKYRCESCREIMMCACDERHGRQFLPHQLHEGQDYGTKERIPVTLGFQQSICRECRGLPLVPAPKAAIHGRTSKIKRFYWRELQFRVFDLLAESGASSEQLHAPHQAVARKEIEAKALADIKVLHATSPKYSLETESEAAFLSRVPIYPVDLRAMVRSGGEVLREDGTPCSPEAFAGEWLAQNGYSTIECESTPLHTIFAVLLWPLIQDRADPLVRDVMFGERLSFEEERSSEEQIWTALPEDFGGPGYAKRRSAEIEEYFADVLQGDTHDLLLAFDLGVDGSHGLRQYLWAHRDIDLARARQLLSIIPADYIRRTLRYLVDDYWHHYLGWPDLFAWRSGEFLFVEVKLSGDKLSDEQRVWIERNTDTLRFPFRLLKIHRDATRAT